MTERRLAFQPIGENDCRVARQSRPIGRIRLTDEWQGRSKLVVFLTEEQTPLSGGQAAAGLR